MHGSNQQLFRPGADRILDIAVVGTGVAGAAAAWLLSRRHRVTVYEAADRPGGHTNTVDVAANGRTVGVDTGFIVYNESSYPNLTALFDHLGVPSQASEMSFAVSLGGGAFEYSGGGLAGLLAQPGNLASPRLWRIVRDVLAFYRAAPRDLAQGLAEDISIADYLFAKGYSRALWDDHLAPMAAAIWSTPIDRIAGYPAASFIRFCDNHGLLKLAGRPVWRTVRGGGRTYLKCLLTPVHDRLRLSDPVLGIERRGTGVAVRSREGREEFDHVVIAAHADQALAMLADPSERERALLGAFAYQSNRAVLHRDRSLMPKRRAAWSSWNFIGQGDTPDDRAVCVTYWMNRLQNLPADDPVFVTLNPAHPVRDDMAIAEFEYDHSVFDSAATDAQTRLWSLQGVDRTWYCGSYFGWGFHEDALQSGLAAAEQLGGIARPWTVDNPNGRIAARPAASLPAGTGARR